jgi:hypothetical protein
VDSPEGRVASVAIKIACDLLDILVLKELFVQNEPPRRDSDGIDL